MTREPRFRGMGPLSVPQILGLAFVARFVVGRATDSILYADEVFQSLEQAHRLVFGAGMIPWEYEYGIRSWAAPIAIALVLKPLQLLGLDSPHIYQPAVEAALCTASLVLPYGVYRIAQTLLNEGAARRALIFASFWYELVSYGHRTTIDVLATYAAVGSLALLLTSRRRTAVLACGALAGLTIVLRFQLLPAIGVMALVALWRWRLASWRWMMGFLVVIVAGGALDYYTWGAWFSSIVLYFQLNRSNDIASQFGVDPFYWYVPVLVALSGGLAIAGGAGLILSWRTSWPLAVVGLVTLTAFSAIGHKEARYVFPLIPLWLFGVAALTANRGELITKAFPRCARVAPFLAGGLVVAFFVISPLGLFNLLPLENRVLAPNVARNDVREAYRALADAEDVVAVLDLSESNPWDLAPYYDLHHDVPLYLPLNDGFRTARADPERYASHVMVPTTTPGPAGFRRLRTFGKVAVWRRVSDPPVTYPPAEYTPRISVLQPVAKLPTVNPRW